MVAERSLFARARKVLRDDGLLAFGSKVREATIYRRLALFERDLAGLVIPERKPLDLRISPLSIDEADAYASLRPDQGADVCRARMHAGHVCLVARDGERLAGHSWHTTRNAAIDFLEMKLPLAPDEAYRYDTFTAPAYRRRGIAERFMDESSRILFEQGCRRVLGAAIKRSRRDWTLTADGIQTVQIGWLAVIRIGPWRKHLIHIEPGKRAPGAPATP